MSYVETTLKMQANWVTASNLAAMTGCKERDLRGEDSPIRLCAISSDAGYKHAAKATQEEFDLYYRRIRRHAIEELRHIRAVRRYRQDQIQGRFAFDL